MEKTLLAPREEHVVFGKKKWDMGCYRNLGLHLILFQMRFMKLSATRVTIDILVGFCIDCYFAVKP